MIPVCLGYITSYNVSGILLMFRKYKVLDPTLQFPEDCSLEGDIVAYFILKILKIHYPQENLLTSTKKRNKLGDDGTGLQLGRKPPTVMEKTVSDFTCGQPIVATTWRQLGELQSYIT